MYALHNEGKSVVAEKYVMSLKIKVFKYMTSVSKNMYIDKLDGIVKKYNNTNHNTIKMKPVNVKSNTYVNSSKKIGNIVRISQCKNVFAKSCVTNWSEEVFMIKII